LNQNILLGKFFGIPLKIHWTFLLLIGYVVYTSSEENRYAAIIMTLFLFFCVVLHEYGHALMARKYQIGTEDIILSPLGGVARLNKIPEEPKHELAIAFAGPFVNLVICLLFFLYLFFIVKESPLDNIDMPSQLSINSFIKAGFWANAVLFLFNLIPAFPMDGGRILRALLAWKMGRARATKIASIIGRIIATVFIAIGLYNEDYIFAMLGFFVFMMARNESNDVEKTEKLSMFTVGEFTNKLFTKLHLSHTMETPINLYKTTGEANFIVYDSLGYIVGTMPTYFLLEANKKNAHHENVTNWLSDRIIYISESETLKQAYTLLNHNGAGILLVKNNLDQVIGVIDRENISRVDHL
jgi:Zn-dependent protease/predicted transcriptional regulator